MICLYYAYLIELRFAWSLTMIGTFYLKPSEATAEFYKPHAFVLEDSSKHNSGVDVFMPSDDIIPAGEQKLIDLGLQAVYKESPEPEQTSGYMLVVRSSTGVKGISQMNAPGIIDPPFRGPLKACLRNHTTEDFKIERGQRLLQLVPHSAAPPCVLLGWPEWVMSVVAEDRGVGFGSTGH
jgi:dUTP pyrophosphatase